MTRKKALINLRQLVMDGALVPENLIVSRDVSAEIDLAFNISDLHGDVWADVLNAYDGSLDAALAVHEAMLPNWIVNGFNRARGKNMEILPEWDILLCSKFSHANVKHRMPSRAWLLAILEALISQEAKR